MYFLLGLIMLFTLFPFIFPFVSAKTVFDKSRFSRELKVLATHKKQVNHSKNVTPKNFIDPEPVLKAQVFYFDPNTLNTEGWLKLGIKEKTALTIQKYVSKGGRFKKPEDLAKIYGMKQGDMERLMPFISIAGETKKPLFTQTTNYNRQFVKKEIPKVDINLADTSIFIALPGIGPGFARRIVNFRTKLGGFYSVEQVAETYGLPDSTFQKVKPYLFVKPGDIKKININTATLDELKTHPYIRYNLANVIVNFRNQHGKYGTVEDIKKIMILEDEVYDKLLPYLAVN